MSCFTNTICQYFKKHYLCNYNINSLFHIKMKLCIRHIITLIIASLIRKNAREKILKYEKQRSDELREAGHLKDKTKHNRP